MGLPAEDEEPRISLDSRTGPLFQSTPPSLPVDRASLRVPFFNFILLLGFMVEGYS